MKKKSVSILFIVLIFVGFIGCPVYGDTQSFANQNEAGYIDLEPIDFYFHMFSEFTRLDFRSSAAKMWYVYQVADDDYANKPLFVFFNGGPGSATSNGLLSLNTGRWTLDINQESGAARFVPNPTSWTQLGNLLHLDARQTGFSYCTMSNPQNIDARYHEFGAQNFNPYVDSADFIRVLLRFLRLHPELQRNPVIIVGESYGGVRATTMLYQLLNYQNFANGSEVYQDKALVQEIQEHYNQVFPEYRNTVVPPQVIVRQFGHQVLIQPAITRIYENQVTAAMFEADNSVIAQLAQSIGQTYTPCRMLANRNCDPISNAYNFVDGIALRDLYNYSRPQDWMNVWFDNAARLLQYTDNLSLMTGTDVSRIGALYASARANAYRVVNTNSSGYQLKPQMRFPELPFFQGLPAIPKTKALDNEISLSSELSASSSAATLTQTFGNLQPWDRYYLRLNSNANYAHWFNAGAAKGYDIRYTNSPHFGYMFLKNLVHVKTFITHANFDLVVYSAAFPAALARHQDILTQVTHDQESRPGVARPGWLLVQYRNDAFSDLTTQGTRVIRFPLYARSGHAVSITEPVELFNDVYEWLNESN